MVANEPSRLSVLLAYSTPTEAIKMGPLARSLSRSSRLRPVVVVSGRNRQMLDEINELFEVTVDADLDIVEPETSSIQIASGALEAYSEFLAENPVDAVLVQGGTATGFAASLAAHYASTPVVHVEAGLRTRPPDEAFPGEIHRRLIAQTASLHLAPTELSRANLLNEGIAAGDVVVTGNTVIDALVHAVALQQSTGDAPVDEACRSRRPIVLVTARPREMYDPVNSAINQAISGIAKARPDALIVISAGGHPLVQEQMQRFDTMENVRVMESLPYAAFCYLLSRATLVLTDSGAIQEQAPSLGVPVLVMRDVTDRPEAVNAGAAKLVGTRVDEIERNVLDLLFDEQLRLSTSSAGNPFGDGRAAVRARAAIEALLGVGQRMPDFTTSEKISGFARADPVGAGLSLSDG